MFFFHTYSERFAVQDPDPRSAEPRQALGAQEPPLDAARRQRTHAQCRQQQRRHQRRPARVEHQARSSCPRGRPSRTEGRPRAASGARPGHRDPSRAARGRRDQGPCPSGGRSPCPRPSQAPGGARPSPRGAHSCRPQTRRCASCPPRARAGWPVRLLQVAQTRQQAVRQSVEVATDRMSWHWRLTRQCIYRSL